VDKSQRLFFFKMRQTRYCVLELLHEYKDYAKQPK